jgi:hypothetical protein
LAGRIGRSAAELGRAANTLVAAIATATRTKTPMRRAHKEFIRLLSTLAFGDLSFQQFLSEQKSLVHGLGRLPSLI